MKTPYLAVLRSLATIPPPAHLNTASLLSIHERTQSSISGVKIGQEIFSEDVRQNYSAAFILRFYSIVVYKLIFLETKQQQINLHCAEVVFYLKMFFIFPYFP